MLTFPLSFAFDQTDQAGDVLRSDLLSEELRRNKVASILTHLEEEKHVTE